MRELSYLIDDVRQQTDNDAMSDKELVRYFTDGVRAIQAIIFKNNPLSSYFQEPEVYEPQNGSREYTLPSDCYADNAVSSVEVEGANGCWSPIERTWPDDGLFGWFTRNKKVVISGDETRQYDEAIRVWYFKRLPKFDKVWATVASVAGQVVTLSNVDEDFGKVDKYASFKTVDGADKLSGLKIASYTTTTVTFPAGVDVSTLVAGDKLTMGFNTSLTCDLPEEVESFLLDYVAKRIYGRNNYSAEASKIELFSEEEKANIIAIFGDASQARTRTPITDYSYMNV